MKHIVSVILFLYCLTIVNAAELNFDSMKAEYMANRDLYKKEGTIKFPSGKLFYWRDIFELPENQQRAAWKNMEQSAINSANKTINKELGALKEATEIIAGKKTRNPKYSEYIRSDKELQIEMKRRLKLGMKRYYQYCDEGHADSCLQYGGYYYHGSSSVKVNYHKARQSFYKACELKNATGCYYLADMYDSGKGVRKNMTKAQLYLQKSCQYGSRRGCAILKNRKKQSSIILMKKYNLNLDAF